MFEINNCKNEMNLPGLHPRCKKYKDRRVSPDVLKNLNIESGAKWHSLNYPILIILI